MKGVICTRTNERFQPTRPLRDATSASKKYRPCARHFNPRVPCGTRRSFRRCAYAGGDISTHASLAGRDLLFHVRRRGHPHFNPRVPCGTRQRCGRSPPSGSQFQPTRPLRDATSWSIPSCAAPAFQPTRPLRDATAITILLQGISKFQPTRPLRDATVTTIVNSQKVAISTHASLAGRDTFRQAVA